MTAENIETPEINWGYNCLTAGIHHGRPEALWNLPLLYAATVLFDKESFKEIVISRIYNDAMQVVTEKVDLARFDAAWAQRVRDHAEEHYDRTLQRKVGELSNYYKSPGFKGDVERVVDLVKDNRLNVFYEPLHSHDSINLLCRILGVSASRAVS